MYLPYSDRGMECCSEHLIELERVISEHQHHGPVIFMGDFNAHGGVVILQGILLHQLITYCNLYAVSLSSLSQDPQYTFHNSQSQTTVDYILASHDTTEYINSASHLTLQFKSPAN